MQLGRVISGGAGEVDELEARYLGGGIRELIALQKEESGEKLPSFDTIPGTRFGTDFPLFGTEKLLETDIQLMEGGDGFAQFSLQSKIQIFRRLLKRYTVEEKKEFGIDHPLLIDTPTIVKMRIALILAHELDEKILIGQGMAPGKTHQIILPRDRARIKIFKARGVDIDLLLSAPGFHMLRE